MPLNYGKQIAIINETTIGSSEQSGTPYVEMHMSTRDTNDPVSSKIYITEKGINFAHKKLKLCGFDSDAQSLVEIQENPALLRGQEVWVDIFEETYLGKQILKCEIMLANPIEKGALVSIDAMLQARTRAPGKGAAPATPARTDKVGPDGLPF